MNETVDVWGDDEKLRFEFIKMWLDVLYFENKNSCQMTGVAVNSAKAIGWLVERYKSGNEDAKQLLMRCMTEGVELPEYEEGSHPYPQELYAAADFPIWRGVVTTRTYRNQTTPGF